MPDFTAESNAFIAAAHLTAVALPPAVIQGLIGPNPVDANGAATPALKGAILLVWETWKTFADAMDIAFTSGAVHPVGGGPAPVPVPPVAPPPAQPAPGALPLPTAGSGANIVGGMLGNLLPSVLAAGS